MPYGTLDATTAVAVSAASLGVPLTSAGQTLGSMRTELRLRLGGRDDNVKSRLDSWINEAYDDMMSSLDLQETRASLSFTTEAGVAMYKLPSTVGTTLYLEIAEQRPNSRHRLRKTDLDSFRKLPDYSADPYMFFVFGDNYLVLWPTPNAAYDLSLDVKVRPARLVQDTDSPVIGREWHEGILLLARAKAFSALMEFDYAQIAMNEYIAFVRRRVDRQADEQEGMVPSLRPARNARAANSTRHTTWGDY